MLALIICLVSFGILLMIFTFFNRKNNTQEPEIKVEFDEDCCGAHEVCDKDSLLSADHFIEYFDDEELDALAGIDAKSLNAAQTKSISEVFYTLKENEVAAWLKSLQLRNIQLPIDLRDEALLIVSERRSVS